MARGDDPNSASCQFFICYDDCSASLDGKYAAFGKVVDGMETVDEIAMTRTNMQDKPLRDMKMEKVEIIEE